MSALGGTGNERFDWLFNIVDNISGPSATMSKRIDALTKQFDDASKASTKLDRSLGSGSGANSFRNALFEVTGIIRNVYDGLTTLAGGAISIGAAMLHGAGDTEDSLKRMELALHGTKEQLDDLEEGVQRATGRSIIGDSTIRDDVAVLLNAGLSMEKARDAFAAAADFDAIKPGSKGAGIDFFASLSAGDVFSSKALGQLKGFGISTKAVTDDIASTLGVSSKTVEEMLGKEKIKASVGMQAVFDVLQKKTGRGLGGFAVEMGDTLNGLITKLVRFPGDFFSSLNKSGAIEPLKASLRSLLEFLNGAGGDRIKAIADRGFGALAKAVGWIAKAENLDKIDAVIERVADIGGVALEVASNIFSIGSSIVSIADSLGVFAVVKVGFEAVAGFAQIASMAVAAFVDELSAEVASIADWVKTVYDTAVGMGKALWEGMADGIKGGVSAIANGASELADEAVNSVKDALGIHSPSKVFMELGQFTAQGFEDGFAAKQGAFSPSIDLSSLELPGASQRPAFSPSITVEVNVSGSRSRDEANEIAQQIREQLIVLLDDMNAEAGA